MASSGFQVNDTFLGTSLHGIQTGVSTTQTPVVLLGSGPFVLTADQFETALQSAVFVLAQSAAANITVVLPSTATILNVLSFQSVTATSGATSAQTYGASTTLKIINLNDAFTVNVLASDGGTGVTQSGVAPLTSQLYSIYEVLTIASPFTVRVVQDVWLTPRVQPEFFTVENSVDQAGGSTTAYQVQFDTLITQSSATSAVSFSLAPENILTVASGVTVLVTFTGTIVSQSTAGPTSPAIALANAGQLTTPLAGLAASNSVTSSISERAVATFSVVYTNTTLQPVTLQVYMTGHDTLTNRTFILGQLPNYDCQLTVTQIS